MIIVDTSVWISHLRLGNTHHELLLNAGHVVCHPFIIGELACGNIKNRSEILSLLQALPQSRVAAHDEVIYFIDAHDLMGKGVGYIDVSLMASAKLSSIPIWTLDHKLKKVSSKLKIAYEIP